MNSVVDYGTIYGVAAIVIYTAVLVTGAQKINRQEQKRRNTDFPMEIVGVLQDIKDIIQEGGNMDKGEYSNRRSSEMIHRNNLNLGMEEFAMKNKLTLSDLINNEPTDDNYEEVVDILAELAKNTYKDYKFLIAKSEDEVNDPNFLQVVSNWSEAPEVHKKVFSKSIEYGIDMQELQLRFADKVERGEVFDLGEDIKVIVDDGTPQPATGVSPINSGLEGGEIAFIVSFIGADNYEEFVEKNLKEDNDE